MSISLCMIVKNEEDNLPRCLDSIKNIVDEMIIVDTGSTDSTIEIAKSYGAQVYNFTWNDSFSDARNYSLKHATGDWILIMDADDELEKADAPIILDLIKNSDADAYYFKTINYIGDKPGFDQTMNLLLRLVKNGKGYFYTNPIHEQLHSNIISINPSAKIISTDIRVYHYGYLQKNIEKQNKRNRNINLLEKELEQKPGYTFALFNLGSEYYAMGDNTKAIQYFEESYKKFDPKDGFSSHLIIKMVSCYINLDRYDDALKLCSVGLKYYPSFTELEYMKGIIQNNFGKYTIAINHFKKCIEMGEAPSCYNVIIGVGTYRSFLMLGEIYYSLDDLNSAVENFKKVLELKPDFTPALFKLISSYCKLNLDQEKLTDKLEGLREYQYDKLDFYIYDILIQEKYFNLALIYIDKSDKNLGTSSYSEFCKGMCNLYLKKYKDAKEILEKTKEIPEYRIKVLCAQAMCNTLEMKYTNSNKILSTDDLDKNNIMARVYSSFNRLMETGNTQLLAEDEKESSLYTIVIFDILKILLIMHEFEIFEKALALLNTINDKTVLLRLAKLYYNENFYVLSYKEFIRSIKLFEIIDLEGSNMLQKLKYIGL